jgi:stearoyl-CoA desaturase (Delta-9 desaturase)
VKAAALAATVIRWFDSSAAVMDADTGEDRIDWARCVPFILLHVACALVFVVGISTTAVVCAIALYAIRMFAITGFYHRYFSHRAFKTTRWAQFVFAFLGATATQRGPLWWAGHHRNHHRNSDTEADVHSPMQHGFLWSHMGWFMSRRNFATPVAAVPDLARFPELRFLDRFDVLAPVVLIAALYGAGELCAYAWPQLGTNGFQLVVWGFLISTVVLAHATFTINSLSHVFGSRRYVTGDTSRNNPLLAMITFGEGWHNNHHHHPHSARQGFAWWEIDLTYLGLRLLAALGIVSDLRPVPAHVYPGGSAESVER